MQHHYSRVSGVHYVFVEADTCSFALSALSPLARSELLADVRYDADEQGVEVVVQVPLGCPKILMLTIVQDACSRVLLRSTPGDPY